MVGVVFLLGIGHEPLPQQHDSALSLPLQQAWAFLPRLFFLQQDMVALQQFVISQQELVLPCGFFAKAVAEKAVNITPQVTLSMSAWTFFIFRIS